MPRVPKSRTVAGSRPFKVEKDDATTPTGAISPKRGRKKKKQTYSKGHRALEKVLLDIKHNTEENERLKKFEREVLALLTPEKNPTEVFEEKFRLQTAVSTPEKKRREGLQIIDHNHHERFFSGAEDLISAGLGPGLENPRCTFEKRLVARPHLVTKHLTARYCPDGPFSDSFMLFLFLVMGVEQDNFTVICCHRFLLHATNSNLLADGKTWVPSLKDIVLVLINYGFTAEKNCPLLDLFKSTERELEDTVHYENRKKKSGVRSALPKVLSLHNVGIVLDLVAKLTRLDAYADGEAAQLVLLLSWMSLDLRTLSLRDRLQTCLTALVDSIGQIGWDTKWLEWLSSKLSRLTKRQEHVKTVCTLLLSFGRSSNLKQITSFHAAHDCLGAPYTFKPTVEPVDVLTLLTSHPVTLLEDRPKLLQIAVGHIEMAVGNNIPFSDMVTMRKLSEIMHFASSRFVDSLHCLSKTLVKTRLCMLSCKWTALMQHMTPQRNSSWRYPIRLEEASTPRMSVVAASNPLTPGQDSDDTYASLPTPGKGQPFASPFSYETHKRSTEESQAPTEERRKRRNTRRKIKF